MTSASASPPSGPAATPPRPVPALSADAAIRLGALALAFGKVDRISLHPDGTTPESDTDHTVMLGLVACAAAAADPTLDVGLVAQFALVHDLVEVHAGDTPTLIPLDADERADKAAREQEAMDRLRTDFVDVPWLVDTLDAYEHQQCREARFVRAIDKAVPKITHVLNGGASLAVHGLSPERMAHDHRDQLDVVDRYAADLPDAMVLLAGLMAAAEQAVRTTPHRPRPGQAAAPSPS